MLASLQLKRSTLLCLGFCLASACGGKTLQTLEEPAGGRASVGVSGWGSFEPSGGVAAGGARIAGAAGAGSAAGSSVGGAIGGGAVGGNAVGGNAVGGNSVGGAVGGSSLDANEGGAGGSADTDGNGGATCQSNACVSEACSDGFRDGNETDIDCGGDCLPCALTRDCAVDADCVSGSCDGARPHRCVPEHCADHHRNQDETDDDCGGSCGPCHDGWRCALDGDCKSGFCDLPRGPICLSAQCLDGVKNGTETDIDCGGGICDGCANGQRCVVGSYDCASQACNPVTHLCQADHCGDNAWDGDETYTDCGGATCRRCKAGELCESAADCDPGLSCFPGNPHFCQ